MKSKKGPFKMKKLSAIKFINAPGVRKVQPISGGVPTTNYKFSSGGQDPHTRFLLDRMKANMKNRPKGKAKRKNLVSRILGAFGL